MLIQERVQLIIKMHNLTPAAFADKIGVQRSNISHILNGRNKPSIDMLERIILNFSRVNAHWLITGHLKEDSDPISQQLVLKINESTPEKHLPAANAQVNEAINHGEIEKIVTFYSDGTFETHIPRS